MCLLDKVIVENKSSYKTITDEMKELNAKQSHKQKETRKGDLKKERKIKRRGEITTDKQT